MPSFADFVLLSAASSYGGAEVLRARRVTDRGVEPPVHLALFGSQSIRDAALEQRLLDLAEAGAPLAHEAVARIQEIGRHEGSLYATAHIAEGVDLATLLEHERRRRATPDVRFVLAVAFSLARVGQELHDLGDVFTARAPGLAGLFPSGMRADAVVLRPDGAVLVRALSGAPVEATAPSAYRAPELAEGRASMASDVFTTIQVLRALLAVDVNAQAAPRLPERCGALPTVLVGALQRRPEDRPLIDAVVDALRDAFADHAPGHSPAELIAQALRREYRSLLADEPPDDDVPAAALAEVAGRRSATIARRTLLYPQLARRAPIPTTGNLVVPTVAMRVQDAEGSDGVDRVFTEEGADVGLTAGRLSVLDVAVASIADSGEQTQRLHRDAGLDLDLAAASSSADDSSPWMSAIEVSSFGSADGSADGPADGPADGAVALPQPPTAELPATVAARPPFAAPVFADSDLEHQDTVKMPQDPGRLPRDVSFGTRSEDDEE